MRIVLALALLSLAGCTEVSEKIAFDSKGGGTYALTVRFDADLWQRAGAHLTKAGRARLEARAFPLTAAAWRDGLEGLEGVEILALAERDAGGGQREVSVRLRFRSLEDLFRWEVLARRSAKVVITTKGEGAGAERSARLEMAPIPFVPVLDPLAALLDADERPPPAAEGLRSHKDPPPLLRFGLERAKAKELWAWIGPAVAKAKFAFEIEVPGRVLEKDGKPVTARVEQAAFAFDFGTLRGEQDRRVRLVWRVRSLDTPPSLAHEGESRRLIVADLPR